MNMKVHATALVDPGATLADDVEVGPYCVVGPDVTIGKGTKLRAHVVLEGPTEIGEDNDIYSFVSIGSAPQDKKYDGEPTSLRIGDRNTIRG